MNYTPEEKKIHEDISLEFGFPIEEIEKASTLYIQGIVKKINEDVPCEILMPYLGKMIPNKRYIEQHGVKTSNTTG